MNFFYEAKIFSPEFCNSIISEREANSSYEDISYWSEELPSDRIEFFNNLSESVYPHIVSYFNIFKNLMDISDVQLNGYTLVRQHPSHHDDLHYDTPIYNRYGVEKTRPFVCIVYLNDNFEGGECIFPAQDYVIKPEQGKLVIFPASYHFPHMVIGVFGNDRYSIRLTYSQRAPVFNLDLNKWDSAYDS